MAMNEEFETEDAPAEGPLRTRPRNGEGAQTVAPVQASALELAMAALFDPTSAPAEALAPQRVAPTAPLGGGLLPNRGPVGDDVVEAPVVEAPAVQAPVVEEVVVLAPEPVAATVAAVEPAPVVEEVVVPAPVAAPVVEVVAKPVAEPVVAAQAPAQRGFFARLLDKLLGR
ncbi:hypothetical protein CLV92_107231 [Kineococcus xinjiangensis]|uniref:Uncharacterized protein n=1 Tax=Kineococcus xinjiangensis TaxID=512762 RepID=A0A2S6IKK1_9ACTN|nr:hypothetical protein [Kineococcus xinjiangensis]PPK94728.1 hypothetical protein CLV92_107231 [Kineococcus xinjiangensis]